MSKDENAALSIGLFILLILLIWIVIWIGLNPNFVIMKKETRGNINFYNCDNIKLMKSKPDNYYDWAIVDPPYFNGPEKLGYYGTRTSSTGVMHKSYPKIGTWKIPGYKYYNEVCRVSKNQIIWGINYYKFTHEVDGFIIWDKCKPAGISFNNYEIASCSSISYIDKVTYMWNGMMQGKSIIEGNTQQGNKKLNEIKIHPTQKPVKLYIWTLEKYANPGNKILDTHGGSMTHAIACDMMGLSLDICEISKEYFDNGLKAFDNYKQQLKLF